MKSIKLYRGIFITLSCVTLLLGGCNDKVPIKDLEIVEEDKTNPDANEETFVKNENEKLFETTQSFEDENQLINYLNECEKKLDEIAKSETVEKIKDSCYNASVKLGNFILDDGSIGGYTWDQISSDGKETILGIANNIDNKLIEYFPEQRDWVIDKWQSFKQKTREITTELIGEDNYEYWGQKTDEWLDKAGDLYEKGKNKVKEKYKDWRDRHN